MAPTSDPILEAIRELPTPVWSEIEHELVSLLIASPNEWRERRTERIEPIDLRHYRDELSLQFSIHSDQFSEALTNRLGFYSRGIDKQLRRIAESPNHRLSGLGLDLFVPLFALPKRVLLDSRIVDHAGHNISTRNRFHNSRFAAIEVFRKINHWADLANEPDLALQIARVLPALAFCIPDDMLGKTHFAPKDLLPVGLNKGGASKRSLSKAKVAMKRYLVSQGAEFNGDQDIRVDELLQRGASLAGELQSFTWADIAWLRDPLVNPLLLFSDHLKLKRRTLQGQRGSNVDSGNEFVTWLLACERHLKLLENLAASVKRTETKGRRHQAETEAAKSA